MDDLEECIAVAQRINERNTSLSDKKALFEQGFLARLASLSGRLGKWTTAQSKESPSTNEEEPEAQSQARRLTSSLSMGAIATSPTADVSKHPGSRKRARAQSAGSEESWIPRARVRTAEWKKKGKPSATKAASASRTNVRGATNSPTPPSEVGTAPAESLIPDGSNGAVAELAIEGSRKRPLDILESPSPPPTQPAMAAASQSANRISSQRLTYAEQAPLTPSAPGPTASSSAPSTSSALQRRKSSRPPKTPQRFASMLTWSNALPTPSRTASGGASGSNRKRQRSSSSVGSDLYTVAGENRQRRRLRDARRRPDKVMAPSDGRPRVLAAVWPRKKENTVRGIAQIVVCDTCNGGAHFACAGIDDDTDMIDEEWICPDCQHLRKTGANSKLWPCVGRCIRSTCVLRAKQAIVHKQEDHLEFVVDRIIGQRPDPIAKGNMEYLVTGDGWKVADATWEPQENLREIFMAKQKDFHSACRQADISVSANSREFVLLPAAADFFGPDGKLKEGVSGWSRDVESEVESRSSSIIPL